ncbi:MAG: carbon starvation protein A, partial [Gemmatimonadaceae bacterium]
KYAAVTLAPLVWLVIVTMTAGWQKLFSADPKMGFLSHARWVRGLLDADKLPGNVKTIGDAQRLIVNDYVNAVVAAFFMVSVIVILADSIRVWLAFRNTPASDAPEAALKAA